MHVHCHSSKINKVGRRGNAPAAINLSARMINLGSGRVDIPNCVPTINDNIPQESYHSLFICSIIGADILAGANVVLNRILQILSVTVSQDNFVPILVCEFNRAAADVHVAAVRVIGHDSVRLDHLRLPLFGLKRVRCPLVINSRTDPAGG